MRRFVFCFALAFAAGLWVVLQIFPGHIPMLTRHAPLLALAAVYGIYTARYFCRPLIACILAGFVAGGLYTAVYHQVFVAPLDTLRERTVIAQAEVRAEPDVYDRNQRVEVKVRCDSVGLTGYPLDTFSAIGYVPLTETALAPGDQIQVLATFYEPTVRQGFDRQRHQMSNGNFLSFSYLRDQESGEAALFEVTHAASTPLRYRPQALARQFGDRILSLLPEREGGFLYALLLGNLSHLDPMDEQNLQKVGLSHIISVSGMHLMFLIGLIYRLFSRRIGVFLSFFVILIFIPMAGASPSIVRAGIMSALSGVAFLFGRESDGQTSLGAALLLLLCCNPYALFSLSLELSFLSTFGILRYTTRLEHILFGKLYVRIANRMARKLVQTCGATISCSLCAMLFTTPILICTFGYVTLLSVPANLITLSAISLVFSLGVFFCLLPFLSGLLTYILTPLIDYIFWSSAQLGRLHWGILYWEESSGKIAVVASVLLVVLIFGHKYLKPRVTIPLCCCALIGATGYGHFVHSRTTRVTLHAVGEGQMISIAQGYQHLSLIDCGCAANQDGMEILRETMNWYGFSEIDTILFTAVDKAHARSAAEILSTIPVSRCILPNHLKESDTLDELTAAAQAADVPLIVWTREGESQIDLPGIAQTTLIGGIDRKLGVQLRDGALDLLILHSMTQNMLDELLAVQPVTGQCVILANQFEKQDYLQRALAITQPEEIILSTGYGSLTSLFDIPVRSTSELGDLSWTIPHL